MTRKLTLVLIAIAASLLLGRHAAYSQQRDGKVTDEFRRQYIKDFKRIGLNTTPGDAMMLRILVESANLKRGVEVGTATGFGAINMGVAFERTGGQLFTIDIDPKMVKTSREHIAKMGLDKTVTVIEGDALKKLAELEGEFDFVFLDAVKQDYLKYFKLIEPKLKKNALIVADNVIRSENQMRDYLDHVQNNPADYDTVIIRASLDKNDGMAISYRLR